MEELGNSYFNTNESDISTIDLGSSMFINNTDSPEDLLNKCRDLVSFPNEYKYRHIVENFLKKSDNKFIENNKNDKIFNEKLNELNDYVKILKKTLKIKTEDFTKIRNFAISKGGFITSEIRRDLYKKIYLLNHLSTYKMLYIDYNAIINKNWDCDKVDIFSEKRIYEDITISSQFDSIIKKDCERSKIFKIFNNENKDAAKFISFDLEKFIKLIFCLNNNIYNYTQGFHDVGLYFLLLYHRFPHYAVSVFQRFIEFNLKELLNIKCNEKKIENGTYKMIEIFDTLKILKFIITFLDQNVKNFFEEIERKENINFNINGENNDDSYPICDFSIKWIISLFNTQINDINKIYRIFDYLMVSHSLAIYFLCAEIIIDYFYKLEDKSILNDKAGQHDYYIESINFDEVDFDYYIEKCEKNLNKYIGNSEFLEMYENLKLNKFSPIISEHPFVEKWIMFNNKEHINFLKYFIINLKMLKNFFIRDDENKEPNKNEEIKNKNKNKL